MALCCRCGLKERRPDGSYCPDCNNAKQREWRNANLDTARAGARDRMRKNRKNNRDRVNQVNRDWRSRQRDELARLRQLAAMLAESGYRVERILPTRGTSDA